jgi:hypothetical protein
VEAELLIALADAPMTLREIAQSAEVDPPAPAPRLRRRPRARARRISGIYER